jgi:hypothetical protein
VALALTLPGVRKPTSRCRDLRYRRLSPSPAKRENARDVNRKVRHFRNGGALKKLPTIRSVWVSGGKTRATAQRSRVV